jgi:tetratricopeptide (TPR) repeat protein
MKAHASILFTCAVFALLPCAALAAGQAQVAPNSLEECMTRGETALRQGRYEDAQSWFERAEKLPGANVAEVNAGIGMADLQLGQYDAARQRETKVLSLVSNPHEQAEAHNLIGTAWLREAGEGGPQASEKQAPSSADKLQSAVKEFEQAVALDPAFDAAYFNLGTALARQGLEAQARAAFRNSITAASKNPASAAHLPFARQGRAPEFAASDSSGLAISSGALRGKFVLLDYWATWCAPCIHALPVIRQLATYFPADEFALVSIDEDENQDAWRSFISAQKMDWTQIWDRNGDIYHSSGFAPRPDMVIPRYVFLDPDGFILHVYGGTDRIGVMAGEMVRTVNAAHTGARAASP